MRQVDSTVTGWEGAPLSSAEKSGCSVGHRVNAHFEVYTRWERDAGKFTAFRDADKRVMGAADL